MERGEETEEVEERVVRHGWAGCRASAGGSGKRLVVPCRRPPPALRSLVYG